MDTAEEQANVLHGLADEFEAVQDIDSNAPGFVIRLRGLQLRAAEIVVQALTLKRLENKPFTDRLWWLAKHHADFAETIEPADVRRVAFLRNLWLDICGLHIADGERTENGVNFLRVKGEPLFATPFDCREIALQALQPDGSEFAIEGARQARQRAAFICRTFAEPAAAVEFVESDYAEPTFKSDLAFLFGVDRATIARRIQSGELRTMPGTSDTAKKVRIHGDDFPTGLKRPNDRKQKLSILPKRGKRQ